MKFQYLVSLVFLTTQFTYGYIDSNSEGQDTNPVPQNGVALMVAEGGQVRYERTYPGIKVSKEDVIKGYERLMTQARRIPRAAQATYIVAIENHPKVVEAKTYIAQNESTKNYSGVIFANSDYLRHSNTLNGLRLAQIAIANNADEIVRQMQNPEDYLIILAQLNTAYHLVKTMLP